jgi:diadenosine tetraphosphate (Ap4A) HIT family hydrolase
MLRSEPPNIKGCRLCKAQEVEAEVSSFFIDHRDKGAPTELVVVEDLSPLVTGHVLIVTRGHYRAVGELETGERVDEVAAYIESVRAKYEEQGVYVVAFEHGPRRAREAGSCIDHAHVHVVPCARRVSVTNVVSSPLLMSIGLSDWRRMEQLRDVRALYQHVSYLWIQDTSRTFSVTVTSADSIPSQALRRWCAEALNLRDWDWRSTRDIRRRGHAGTSVGNEQFTEGR